jgi:hypothetical protein
MSGTSPASVVLNGIMYLFYTGSGDDGVWFTSTTDGQSWAFVQKVNAAPALSVMVGTSPNAVIMGGTVYLFYTGSGGDGIWYTTTSTGGASWSPVQCVGQKTAVGQGVMTNASATSLVNSGTLSVFYPVNATAGLSVIGTTNGSSWGSLTSVTSDCEVVTQGVISASAVAFDGLPFLFWNGGATEGISYSSASFDLDTEFSTIIQAILTDGQACITVTDPQSVASLDSALGQLQGTEQLELESGGADAIALDAEPEGTGVQSTSSLLRLGAATSDAPDPVVVAVIAIVALAAHLALTILIVRSVFSRVFTGYTITVTPPPN